MFAELFSIVKKHKKRLEITRTTSKQKKKNSDKNINDQTIFFFENVTKINKIASTQKQHRKRIQFFWKRNKLFFEDFCFLSLFSSLSLF